MKGIAFHGSGGLLYYYLGIAKYIQENYNTDELKFCGVSGGCLPSMLLASKLSVDTMWKNCFLPWINEANSIKTNGAILQFFSDESMSVLRNNFKLNCCEDEVINNINKRLSIRMSKVQFFSMSQVYVDEWDSINDLLECVVASCWLPGLFGRITRSYKGGEYIDGGFPNTIENRGKDWLHIRIDTFQSMGDEMKLLLYCMSLTTVGSTDISQRLYDLGYNDAKKHSAFFSGLKNETVLTIESEHQSQH